jgi:hypothetical protein
MFFLLEKKLKTWLNELEKQTLQIEDPEHKNYDLFHKGKGGT